MNSLEKCFEKLDLDNDNKPKRGQHSLVKRVIDELTSGFRVRNYYSEYSEVAIVWRNGFVTHMIGTPQLVTKALLSDVPINNCYENDILFVDVKIKSSTDRDGSITTRLYCIGGVDSTVDYEIYMKDYTK